MVVLLHAKYNIPMHRKQLTQYLFSFRDGCLFCVQCYLIEQRVNEQLGNEKLRTQGWSPTTADILMWLKIKLHYLHTHSHII